MEAGVLTVMLESAYGLRNMDLFKKQDPYCILECGRVKLLSTTHFGGGKNPVWNERFAFHITTEQELTITVKDQDVVFKDDHVGSAKVDLAQARRLRHQRMTVPVMRKSRQHGAINLLINFAPTHSVNYTAMQQGVMSNAAACQNSAAGYGINSTYYSNDVYPGLDQNLGFGSLYPAMSQPESSMLQPAATVTAYDASAGGLSTFYPAPSSASSLVSNQTAPFSSQTAPYPYPQPFTQHSVLAASSSSISPTSSTMQSCSTWPPHTVSSPAQLGSTAASGVKAAAPAEGTVPSTTSNAGASGAATAAAGVDNYTPFSQLAAYPMVHQGGSLLSPSQNVSRQQADTATSLQHITEDSNTSSVSKWPQVPATMVPASTAFAAMMPSRAALILPAAVATVAAASGAPTAASVGAAALAAVAGATVAGSTSVDCADLAARNEMLRFQFGRKLAEVDETQSSIGEHMQQIELEIERLAMAGVPDAAAAITDLGLASSQLREELVLSSKQRALLQFSVRELEKLQGLLLGLLHSGAVSAADAADLQEGVTSRLWEAVHRLQQDNSSQVCSGSAFVPISTVDVLQATIARLTASEAADSACKPAATAEGMGPGHHNQLTRNQWQAVLQEFNLLPINRRQIQHIGTGAGSASSSPNSSCTATGRSITWENLAAPGLVLISSGTGSASFWERHMGPPAAAAGLNDQQGPQLSPLADTTQLCSAGIRTAAFPAGQEGSIGAGNAPAASQGPLAAAAHHPAECILNDAVLPPQQIPVSAVGLPAAAAAGVQVVVGIAAKTPAAAVAESSASVSASTAMPVTAHGAPETPAAAAAAAGSAHEGPVSPATAVAIAAAIATGATAPSSAVAEVGPLPHLVATKEEQDSSRPSQQQQQQQQQQPPGRPTPPPSPPPPPSPAFAGQASIAAPVSSSMPAPRAAPPPPPLPPKAAAAAAASAAAVKQPSAGAPPRPPPPLPPKSATAVAAGDKKSAGLPPPQPPFTAFGKKPTQLGNGVNVGAKAPLKAPALGGKLNGTAADIMRVPEVVQIFQQLRKEMHAAKGVGAPAKKEKGTGAANGGSAACADPAQVVNEIKARGGHTAKVAADYEMRRANIAQWAKEIVMFKPSDMGEVSALVTSMEEKLNGLYDECAELKMFGEWPESKYDACKVAAAQYRQFISLKTVAESCSTPGDSSSNGSSSSRGGRSCQTVLSNLSKQYDQLVWKVEEYQRDRDGIEKRFKEAGMPWPGKTLIDQVKVASLAYGRAYMAAVKQEVHRLAQQQPAPANLQQKQLDLLKNAVAFLFRVHQFVTGLDPETRDAFVKLAALLQQVQAGEPV